MPRKYQSRRKEGDLTFVEKISKILPKSEGQETLVEFKTKNGLAMGDSPSVAFIRLDGSCHDIDDKKTFGDIQVVSWFYQWNAGKVVKTPMRRKCPPEFSDKYYRDLAQYCGGKSVLTTTDGLSDLVAKFNGFMKAEAKADRVSGGTLSIAGFEFQSKSGRVYRAITYAENGKSWCCATSFGSHGKKVTNPILLDLQSLKFEDGGEWHELILPKSIQTEEEFQLWKSVQADLDIPVKMCKLKTAKKPVKIVQEPCHSSTDSFVL